MDNLVNELAQLLIDDKAFLFIDASLPLGPGQPPPTQKMARALAARLGMQLDGRDLFDVAQEFEGTYERNALITTLREKCEDIEKLSNPLYQCLAKVLPAKTRLVTTQFDRRLKRALESSQRKFEVIKDDKDVLFSDKPYITLIKIQGDIDSPARLVITRQDLRRATQNPALYEPVLNLLTKKHLIFLGYDLWNPLFEELYENRVEQFGNLIRLGYAIVSPSGGGIKRSNWRDLKICPGDPFTFLEELIRAIEARLPYPDKREEILPPLLPDHPYKALDSFTFADEAIFAGRLEESHRLANRIWVNRLVVLYGESGSGKTSLLQAGAGPLLAKEGCLVAICKLGADQPLVEQLRQELIKAGAVKHLAPPAGDDLSSLIKIWQRILDQPIVLVIDQFEQFFLVYNEVERQTSMTELSQLRENRDLNLRLALIIREDFLGRLDTLSEDLPGLLEARFRLERLSQSAAEAAITEPAKPFNIFWEPSLVQRLLAELSGGSNGLVMPPQLQIACHYLYEKFARPILDTKPEAKLTLGQFERVGSLAEILGRYLNEAMAKFPPRQQETVRSLLGMLTSSSDTKQRLPLAELARAVEEPNKAQNILDQLTEQRLLQRYAVTRAEQPEWEYELIHDYLVERIKGWLGREFWERKAVLDLVRLALPAWEKDKTLLSPDALRLVAGQRGRIRFSVVELEMIYAAAVSYDDNPEDWANDLDRAAGSTGKRQRVLLDLLDPEKRNIGFARRHAIKHLASFPHDDVAQKLAEAALTDTDPMVQEAAAQSIADLVGPTGRPEGQVAVRQLVAAVGSNNDRTAWKALTIIRQQQPASQAFLDKKLQGNLQRRVWLARWQHSWPRIMSQTLRGVVGGFLGGMAIYGLFLDSNATISQMVWGLFLNGLSGTLSAGGSAFVRSVLHSLQDYTRPWRVWFIVTVVGTILSSLGLTLPSLIAPGSRQIAEKLIAGGLLGLGLVGGAVTPQGTRLLRLGLAILAGMAAFGLVGLMGPPFNTFSAGNWWLLPMGGIAGMGFFWALASDLTDKP